MSLKVGVVDDHEIYRRGLVAALRDDPEVVVTIDVPNGPIEEADVDVLIVSSRALHGIDASCPVVVLATRSTSTTKPGVDEAAVLPATT